MRGLTSEIENISVLDSGKALNWKIVGKISWSPVPGLVYIDAPLNSDLDKYMTIIKIKLKSPLKTYIGEGGLGL